MRIGESNFRFNFDWFICWCVIVNVVCLNLLVMKKRFNCWEVFFSFKCVFFCEEVLNRYCFFCIRKVCKWKLGCLYVCFFSFFCVVFKFVLNNWFFFFVVWFVKGFFVKVMDLWGRFGDLEKFEWIYIERILYILFFFFDRLFLGIRIWRLVFCLVDLF